MQGCLQLVKVFFPFSPRQIRRRSFTHFSLLRRHPTFSRNQF
jgi:hypothetical protein